jgi:hypothetical protein
MPLAIGWFVWGGLLGLSDRVHHGRRHDDPQRATSVLFILGFIFPLLWINGAFMDKPRY